LALIRRIARELQTSGTYTTMTAEALTYDEINGMLENRRREIDRPLTGKETGCE
jgi:hypothetical protein